jgi:hypothetical protein
MAKFFSSSSTTAMNAAVDEDQPLLLLRGASSKEDERKRRGIGGLAMILFCAAVSCACLFGASNVVVNSAGGGAHRVREFGIAASNDERGMVMKDSSSSSLSMMSGDAASSGSDNNNDDGDKDDDQDDEEMMMRQNYKQVEPELAFHTEEEIASVIAAALEGDEKKTTEREEEKMRRRIEKNNNAEERSAASKEQPMMGKREASFSEEEEDERASEEGGNDIRGSSVSSLSSQSSMISNRQEQQQQQQRQEEEVVVEKKEEETQEDRDDQEDEAEEQSQAEEASRAWDLSTYLNVQPNSENSAESLVALLASAGGDERELEKYVKVVEPIDPSEWPVNIDKAMYALKSIFRLKAKAVEAAQMEAKLGDFLNSEEIEREIATRRRRHQRRRLMKSNEKEEPSEETEKGKLGYFEMDNFVQDVIKGRANDKLIADDESDYDESAARAAGVSDVSAALLGNSMMGSSTSSLGYFDLNNFVKDALSPVPQKKTSTSDDEAGVSFLGRDTRIGSKKGTEEKKLPSLGYFNVKEFVKDALSEAPRPKNKRDFMLPEEDTSGVHLDAMLSAQLGDEREPTLGNAIEESPESIESLKPLGLTADDVKVLYKAYKKEKKEKESLEGNLEKIGSKSTIAFDDEDENDKEMTSANAWNLNHLRGMGWFEALVDRDKETGKLSSKWWQTEKIPELGKLFSHVYRWQLAKDAKNEKTLILDADGLLDTSNLAIPMDAIRVISAHASNDFDIMFLGNLGTKDPIFETFPDSSGNVIEIRKWQGTQDATNANAYIVSAQFVNKIFDFILSSDMNAPKESLENWLGGVICGAKEQEQQQDDVEARSSLGLESTVDEVLAEENTLAKKPVVGKHVFNCYSAAGVQVKPSSDEASKQQQQQQQNEQEKQQQQQQREDGNK